MPPSGLICGDCATEMAKLPEDSVDLVVTSPPYAQQRKGLYDGVPADKYVEWFMPVANEIRRVLKPSGSFILNIKEHIVDGERSTYVLDLVKAMRSEAGFRWVDDYIWVKKNPFPGKWHNRLKDGWEHLYHFSLEKHIKMRHESVMMDVAESTKRRFSGKPIDFIKKPSIKDNVYQPLAVNDTCNRERVHPPNVITSSSFSGAAGISHPATFPEIIPDFFIRLFTDPGDLVLDPFAGSGTTALAAARLGRRWIGIEINPEYVDEAAVRLARHVGQERLAST